MATVGVDMGTAHVRVSLFSGGTAVLVEDAQGAAHVPAVVCFEAQRQRFGRAALDHAWAAADKTVRSAKRMLVRRFDHPIVQGYARFFPIEADAAGALRLGAGGAAGAPENVLASLLGYMATAVMNKLEAWPEGVVLTEPGWFDWRQRDALSAAARSASMDVVRMLPDSVAALLPMAISAQGEQRVAVVDVGAGGVTAAIALVDARRVRLLGSVSDSSVGGDDVDAANTWTARAWLAEKASCDLHEPGHLELLRQACEQIKVELTGAQSASRFLPFARPTNGEPSPTLSLKRAELELRLADLIQSIENCCRRVLFETRSRATDIQALLLVGGMSRIPLVRAQIEGVFSHRAAGGVDPMRAIAAGAALAAASHDGQIPPLVIDDTAWCGGRGRSDEEMAKTQAPAATTLPAAAPGTEYRSAPGSATEPDPSSASPSLDYRSSPVSVPPSAPSSVVPSFRSSPFSAVPSGPDYRSSPLASSPLASVSSAPSSVVPSSPFASSPFSAVPSGPDYRSSPFTSAGPPRISEGPHSGPAPSLAAVIDHGRFTNPTTAAEVVALPLTRRLTPEDIDPIPLAVLFARILSKKPFTGTLEISSGGSTVPLPLRDGFVMSKQKEYAPLPKVFCWASGTYKTQRSLVGTDGWAKFGLARFVIDGLRMVLRDLERHTLEDAIGARLNDVPKLRLDRTRIIDSLSAHEQRLAKLNCDGARTGSDAIHHGGAMPGTMIQLLVLLTAFDCLEWSAPQIVQKESLQEQLEKRFSRMKHANHFDVLHVHWSATSAEVAASYHQLTKELAPEGEWFKASPAICRQIRDRIEAAYAVLRDPHKRIAHRREAYPAINVEATVDLMSQRAQALGFRAEDKIAEKDARSTRELITELGGSAPPPPRRGRKDVNEP